MTRTSFVTAIRLTAAVSAIAAATPASPAPARDQAVFNGTWSVLIITESGPCDRAYPYPLRVSTGKVSYASPGFSTISPSSSTSTISPSST